MLCTLQSQHKGDQRVIEALEAQFLSTKEAGNNVKDEEEEEEGEEEEEEEEEEEVEDAEDPALHSDKLLELKQAILNQVVLITPRSCCLRPRPRCCLCSVSSSTLRPLPRMLVVPLDLPPWTPTLDPLLGPPPWTLSLDPSWNPLLGPLP